MWKGLISSRGCENPHWGTLRRLHLFLNFGTRKYIRGEKFSYFGTSGKILCLRWVCNQLYHLGYTLIKRPKFLAHKYEHAGIQRNESIRWQVINAMKGRKWEKKSKGLRMTIREALQKERENRPPGCRVLIPALLSTCMCACLTGSQSPALWNGDIGLAARKVQWLGAWTAGWVPPAFEQLKC